MRGEIVRFDDLTLEGAGSGDIVLFDLLLPTMRVRTDRTVGTHDG